MKNEEYPVVIDLGKERECCSYPMDSTKKPKKGKKEIYYPTAYVPFVEGLESLPKEGYALIKFKRKGLSIHENQEGDTSGSLDLEIQELHVQEKASGDKTTISDLIFGAEKGDTEGSAEMEDEE
jgi:hypothetical protein